MFQLIAVALMLILFLICFTVPFAIGYYIFFVLGSLAESGFWNVFLKIALWAVATSAAEFILMPRVKIGK